MESHARTVAWLDRPAVWFSQRVSYGWVILGVTFVNLFMGWGLSLTFSVFYNAIIREFAWSRGAMAGIYSTSMAIVAISYPMLGLWISRRGLRSLTVTGSICLGIGLLLSGAVQTPALLYLTFGIMGGFGFATLGWMAQASILPQWFSRQRGTASGILFSGSGMGVVVLAPLSQYLIDIGGWRLAVTVLGVAMLLILVPLNVFLLRNHPADLELDQSGSAGRQGSDGGLDEGIRVWAALKTLPFFGYFGTLFFVALGLFVVNVHQAAYLTDIGFSGATVAVAVAVVGFSSSLGRFLFGWASDVVGQRLSVSISIVLSVLGLVFLMLLRSHTAGWLLWSYVWVFGVSFGARSPIISAMAADRFSGRDYGLIWALISMGHAVGTALGPWVGGTLFDLTGSYYSAFEFSTVMTILGGITMWVFGTRTVSKGARGCALSTGQ